MRLREAAACRRWGSATSLQEVAPGTAAMKERSPSAVVLRVLRQGCPRAFFPQLFRFNSSLYSSLQYQELYCRPLRKQNLQSRYIERLESNPACIEQKQVYTLVANQCQPVSLPLNHRCLEGCLYGLMERLALLSIHRRQIRQIPTGKSSNHPQGNMCGQFRFSSLTYLCLIDSSILTFGLWEETGVPGGNTCGSRESI